MRASLVQARIGKTRQVLTATPCGEWDRLRPKETAGLLNVAKPPLNRDIAASFPEDYEPISGR